MSGIPNRKVFTETLLSLAKEDQRIIALSSDSMGSATLDKFAAELPEQFVEVGIAEQNLVGIAAGMATCGKITFPCSPACFLSTRSADQVKVDVAYSNNNVKLIGISGGVSYGALGSTHHSLQDIALMRTIPGLTVIIPADNVETEQITKYLVGHDGPVYLRLGRGAAADVHDEDFVPEIGKGCTLLQGDDLTIVATGEVVRAALDAGMLLQTQGICARVIEIHTIKPLDEEILMKAAEETGRIITVEEHGIYGGLGGAVAELLAKTRPTPLKIMGIPDEPAVIGSQQEIFAYYGLNAQGIVAACYDLMEKFQK